MIEGIEVINTVQIGEDSRFFNPLCCRLRFYLLFGDEYNLSAPRSGAPGGGAGEGTPPPQRFFGFERARR